jgi:hypothetical protein
MASSRGIRAGRAFVELFADDTKLVRALRAAQRKLRAFGGSIRGMGLRVAGIGTALLTPLIASARYFSSYGDQVAKMAKRTGFSVEALSELKFVASQTGTEFESLEMGLRRMQRSIYDAGRGMATQSDALADIGLAVGDLDGLAPVDQFKLLADRIGQVEDPTRRAAIAMTLFGRTGTNLLPMFAQGAEGISALQEEARRLGLSMSGEGAAAAEVFTDALDRLWKVVRQGVFNVGAALAPMLTRLADTLLRLAVTASEWIKANRQLVVQAAKIASVITGAGIALILLGGLLLGSAVVMGALASAVGGVVSVLGGLTAALALIVSPIGALIFAVTALSAYLLHASGVAGQALGWLADRFTQLRDRATQTFRGIADALAAGDVSLAARILWLALKAEWVRGTNFIRRLWLGFKHFIMDVLVGAFTGALSALQLVWHGLEAGWIETTAFLQTAWLGFVNIFTRSWERMRALAAKTWNVIKSLFDDSLDPSRANAEIDQALRERLSEIDAGTGEQVIETDRRRESRRRRAARLNEQTLGVIGQRYEDEQDRQAREQVDAQRDAERALIDARREWEQAIAEARQKREAVEAEGGTPLGLDGIELPDLSALGDELDRAMDRIASVGSFNPAALVGMAFQGDAAERTADAAEATARNTKRIEREVRTGGLTFT